MNSKTQAWISAARLRTLPLSISGILVGSAYAYLGFAFAKANSTTSYIRIVYSEVDFNWWIPALALMTTLGFQVLSNFANDYGDGVKGTDNETRIGPMRALQSGLILPHEMKRAMIITAVITIICAIALIYVSLGWDQLLISLLFLVLGISAIWAAIKYTVGDNAYGYRGLGDVFVFIFFGPVSVVGIYYLITQEWSGLLLLPSITIGMLSVAVLNLNNMRDIESDKLAGKNTLAVKLGLSNSKKLHYLYLGTAFLSILIYLFLVWTIVDIHSSIRNFIVFLPALAFIPLAAHGFKVSRINTAPLLDPELKKVALSTFLLAIFCVISVWVIV